MKFIDGPTGRELTGDEIPYHLRDNAPPLGRCDSCGRRTWAPEVGKACKMPSPTGKVCRGTFRSIPLDPATPGLGATVVTEPTEASLRGGDSIVSAAHPTPDERREDILGFLDFVQDTIPGAVVVDRSYLPIPEFSIANLITRYLAERPRSQP